MQTFSYLQRDSSYQKNIKLIALFVLLVIYESLTSIYPFLSPLFGLLFLYALEINDIKRNINKILLFLFIVLYEIDKDFVLFSFFLFLYFSKRYIIAFIDIYIFSKILKTTIFVAYAYFGYYLLNLLLSFIFDVFTPSIGIEYLFYIIIDIILSLILLP